jgi:hypothetical protein
MKTAESLPEPQRSPLTATAPGTPDPSVKSLVERLAIWMPGLSDTEARYALGSVAREFCERTNCWTKETSWQVFPDVPGTTTRYSGEVPAGAVALRVRESRYGTRVWPGLPPFAHVFGLPGPRPYFLFDAFPPEVGAFRLRAAALGGEAPFFSVRLVLAPEIGGEAFPPDLVERWGEALVSGARANLALTPGKPWSDPQGAALHGQKYAAAVAFARGEFECAGVPSHLQTRSKVPFLI